MLVIMLILLFILILIIESAMGCQEAAGVIKFQLLVEDVRVLDV